MTKYHFGVLLALGFCSLGLIGGCSQSISNIMGTGGDARKERLKKAEAKSERLLDEEDEFAYGTDKNAKEEDASAMKVMGEPLMAKMTMLKEKRDSLREKIAEEQSEVRNRQVEIREMRNRLKRAEKELAMAQRVIHMFENQEIDYLNDSRNQMGTAAASTAPAAPYSSSAVEVEDFMSAAPDDEWSVGVDVPKNQLDLGSVNTSTTPTIPKAENPLRTDIGGEWNDNVGGIGTTDNGDALILTVDGEGRGSEVMISVGSAHGVLEGFMYETTDKTGKTVIVVVDKVFPSNSRAYPYPGYEPSGKLTRQQKLTRRFSKPE